MADSQCNPIQGANMNEDQAYMNIDVGIITAEKHAEYKRVARPLVGKYRLEYRKYRIGSLI